MATSEHIIEELTVHTDIVRVVQITDSHLFPEEGGKLLGMDTDHSLKSVIDLSRKEQSKIDLLLATGDLSDGGAPEAYARLKEYFRGYACPSFWLPGNHDESGAMAEACGGMAAMGREIQVGGWQILMLNSQVPGEVGGRLGTDELAFLDAALQRAVLEGLHSLVVLHHHPVPTGCEWLDEQIVADADMFFNVLYRHSSVRGVLWGHVHQEKDQLEDGMRLLSTPSTCVQFAPDSKNFKADDQPPGYRWLELHADGRMNTGVSRVTDVEFTVNLDEGGYL